MSEFDKLHAVLIKLHFTPEQATYSARKLIACKARIDRKYLVNEQENPFFLSSTRA